MANIWSGIGVVIGILFIFLLFTQMQADKDHKDSRDVIYSYNEENDLLEDLEKLIVIEDVEEELEDEKYFNDEE